VIVRAAVLLTIWVALQGELTLGNVLGGAIVVAAIEVLFPPHRRTSHRAHPWGAARFAARLLADLVKSSWTVVVAVLRPTADRVHTEVVAVPLTTSSRLVASIVANSITLTPGTMTVDIASGADGYVLSVHVLGRIDHDEFVASIAALERRVLAAAEPTSSGQDPRPGGAS
jgi:multicomponent Na+:H+ antiporter subunit E